MRLAAPAPFRATIRILLLAASALLVFGITALICAFPLLWFRASANASVGIVLLGVVCGLIAWLFIVIFHVRRESLTLLDDGREPFGPRLRRELDELGYEPGETIKGRTVFKPRFTSYLVGGSVQVTERTGGAVITGPKVFIEILRKRLKVLQHLTGVQRSIRETRVRQGRHLLRRVEIDLRVSAAQWQQVYDEVIAVLARDNSEIVCEIHILAQNEGGILDLTVETAIRDRLKQQNIPVEIRKEPKLSDPKLIRPVLR